VSARHRRIEAAEEKLESLRREMILKLEAHSPNLTMEDVDALNRAKADLAQAETLWSDLDGLLVPYEEQGQYRPANDD